MRNVYICQACAAHYLPPENMHYPATGIQASPVHCANPRCAAALEQGVGVPAEVLALIQRQADADERGGRRNRQPARGRRAASGPGSARSKLR